MARIPDLAGDTKLFDIITIRKPPTDYLIESAEPTGIIQHW